MAKSEKPYHHGDLAPSLRMAAREILKEEGLSALSLRSVAKRAGVSHAAPYRHFASREALAVYQTHPLHQAIVPFVAEAASERRLVDYEA